jgi:hypothetical protein
MIPVVLDCKNFDAVVAGSPELVARNRHLLVAFDAAAVETIELRFRLPTDYVSGSNVTGTLTMFAASATTGAVRCRVAFERVQAGAHDIDADGFATAVDATSATADATSGESFTCSFTLSNANLDGAAAGDVLRVQISRVGTDGADTMTGDAQFLDLVLTQ